MGYPRKTSIDEGLCRTVGTTLNNDTDCCLHPFKVGHNRPLMLYRIRKPQIPTQPATEAHFEQEQPKSDDYGQEASATLERLLKLPKRPHLQFDTSYAPLAKLDVSVEALLYRYPMGSPKQWHDD